MKTDTIAIVVGITLGLAFTGLAVVIIEIARTLPGVAGFAIGFVLGFVAGGIAKRNKRLKQAIKNESIKN